MACLQQVTHVHRHNTHTEEGQVRGKTACRVRIYLPLTPWIKGLFLTQRELVIVGILK